jgi:hypothetical protein
MVSIQHMRRIIQYFVVVLFLIGLVLSVAGLVYLRRVYGRNEDVSPVRLDRTLGSYCTEPSTANNFQEFWGELRGAVRSEDKDKLFSLIHTCGFVWWERPSLPLKSADCVPGPTEDCHYSAYLVGGRQLFQSRNDFEETYGRIFTKANRDRILNGTPWETANGYAISWEPAQYETYSLNFERLEGIGFKFTGLDWEPEPLVALKSDAARAREKARASPSPPPNLVP